MRVNLKYFICLVSLVASMLFASEASARSSYNGYIQTAFDRDFMACSNLARQKSVGRSDALYLGYFYGCMMSMGHDTSML